jgi:hypothetical protein
MKASEVVRRDVEDCVNDQDFADALKRNEIISYYKIIVPILKNRREYKKFIEQLAYPED